MLQCRCLWCPVQHVSDYYIHSPRIRVCELDAGRLHPGSSTAYGRESWIRPSLIGWLPNEKKWTLKWKKSQISRNSIGAGSFFLRTPPQLFMGEILYTNQDPTQIQPISSSRKPQLCWSLCQSALALRIQHPSRFPRASSQSPSLLGVHSLSLRIKLEGAEGGPSSYGKKTIPIHDMKATLLANEALSSKTWIIKAYRYNVFNMSSNHSNHSMYHDDGWIGFSQHIWTSKITTVIFCFHCWMLQLHPSWPQQHGQ